MASFQDVIDEHEGREPSTHLLPPPPSPPLPTPPPIETYHNFFKQQRAMNYENYLKLKKEEKLAVRKYRAATLIQKIFRGWLIRCNLKLIRQATIKIQAAWRGAIARQRYKILDKARQEKRRAELEHSMATKIQATWRGFYSRKHNFNFKLFKEIQEKNRKAQEAAERANDLDSTLSGSSIDSNRSADELTTSQRESNEELKPTHSSMIKSLENLLQTDLAEVARKLSPTRIAQLYEYAKAEEKATGGRKGSESRRHSKLEKFLEFVKEGGQLDSYAAEDNNSLAALLLSKALVEEESVPAIKTRRESEDMFPELPDSDDYLVPNPEKVAKLREAIKLLRNSLQDEAKELEKLAKVHYLMRTAAIPGVFSDVYTNELTPIEKKLKQIKFFGKKKTCLADTMEKRRGFVVDRTIESKPRTPYAPVQRASITALQEFHTKTRRNFGASTLTSPDCATAASINMKLCDPHPCCCSCILCCNPSYFCSYPLPNTSPSDTC